MALPVDEIGLVAGIVDTLKVLFGEGHLGQFIIYALGVVTLITFIGNMVSWTMGSSRAAAEGDKEGELPQIAAKTSDKHGTPVGANLITGLVSTSVIIIYAFFANTNDELFWSMFASFSCVFLMPYLFMFPAYLKLRTTDADQTRPFRIPGNLMVQKVITAVCFLIVFQSVVLFIFPDIIFGNIDWTYSLPILTGVLITIAVGEILLMHANKRNNIKTTGEIA